MISFNFFPQPMRPIATAVNSCTADVFLPEAIRGHPSPCRFTLDEAKIRTSFCDVRAWRTGMFARYLDLFCSLFSRFLQHDKLEHANQSENGVTEPYHQATFKGRWSGIQSSKVVAQSMIPSNTVSLQGALIRACQGVVTTTTWDVTLAVAFVTARTKH